MVQYLPPYTVFTPLWFPLKYPKMDKHMGTDALIKLKPWIPQLKQISVNRLGVSLTGGNYFDNHIVHPILVQTKYSEPG